MPALFTRISAPPSSCRTRFAAARRVSRSVTSAAIATAPSPSSRQAHRSGQHGGPAARPGNRRRGAIGRSPRSAPSANSPPKLVDLTDSVLFGDVWERTELPKRDRSLITVASLITSSSFEQLSGHLRLAKQNGLTETELKEAIIHLSLTSPVKYRPHLASLCPPNLEKDHHGHQPEHRPCCVGR